MRRDLPFIIVNPSAGGGSAGRDWKRAAPTILNHFGPFEHAFTKHPGHAAAIAEEQSRAGRRLLIAYGGDGTISGVAGGIIRAGASSELGVLPRGTGSDFQRSLELPSRLVDAAHHLRNSRCLLIDVGKVTYEKDDCKTDTRYFVNSASFGLSGEVADDANRSLKTWGGKISFASSTLKSAIKFDHPEVFIRVDDEPERRFPVTIVCLNNGRFFGGGMKIAPEASLVDGRLDVVVVQKMSFLSISSKGPLLYAGAHLGLPEVQHRLVASAQARPVDRRAEVRLEIDGESPGRLPASFEVCARALKVRVSK